MKSKKRCLIINLIIALAFVACLFVVTSACSDSGQASSEDISTLLNGTWYECRENYPCIYEWTFNKKGKCECSVLCSDDGTSLVTVNGSYTMNGDIVRIEADNNIFEWKVDYYEGCAWSYSNSSGKVQKTKVHHDEASDTALMNRYYNNRNYYTYLTDSNNVYCLIQENATLTFTKDNGELIFSEKEIIRAEKEDSNAIRIYLTKIGAALLKNAINDGTNTACVTLNTSELGTVSLSMPDKNNSICIELSSGSITALCQILGAEDDGEAESSESKSGWVWLVEPSIEADNIDVIYRYEAKYDEEMYDYEMDFSYDGMIAYDCICKITQNQKHGIINYSGLVITGIEFNFIEYDNPIYNGFYLYGDNGDYFLSDQYELIEDESRYYPPDFTGYYVWMPDIQELRVVSYGVISDNEAIFSGVTAALYGDEEHIYISDGYVEKMDGTCHPITTRMVKDDFHIFDVLDVDDLGERFIIPDNISLDNVNRKIVLVNNGQVVSSEYYESGGVYADGVIPMKKNGKWGYLDASGKEVLPFVFDTSYNATNGYIAVCKDGQYALYDVSGNVVIDFGVFDQIRPVYEGMFWAQKDGLWGVVGLSSDVKNTNTILPEKYCDEISATVNTKSGLRMREGPSTDYNVIGMLSNKKKVTLCGYTGDWAYIKADSAYGWVKMSYLKVTQKEINLQNESEIVKSILRKGDAIWFGEFKYDDPMAFYLAWDYVTLIYDDYFFEDNCTVFPDAEKIEKLIFDAYHISANRNEEYRHELPYLYYSNGCYYVYGDWGRGDVYSNTLEDVCTYYITDNLVYLTFTLIRDCWFDDTIITENSSAVVYLGNEDYALVEYLPDNQNLPPERLIHYLYEFE